MRTEIKRKLMMWPLVASATITAVSFIQTHTPRIGALASTGSLTSWWSQNAPEIEWNAPLLGKLAGHDSAAAHHRVVDHHVLAPVRNENYELAGMVGATLTPNQSVPSIDRLLVDLFGGDVSGDNLFNAQFGLDARAQSGFLDLTGREDSAVTFAESRDSSKSFSTSQPVIGLRTLAQLRRRPDAAKPASVETASDSLVIEDETLDSLAQQIPEGVIELLPQSSSIPKSVRVLAKPAPQETSVSDSIAGWPQTPRLSEQIATLRGSARRMNASVSPAQLAKAESAILRWSDRIADSLERLQSVNRLGDASAAEQIETLRSLAADGLQSAELVGDRATQVAMLQVAHALNRRIAVWKPIYELNQSGNTFRLASSQIDNDRAARVSIHESIAAVRRDVLQSEDRETWTTFLLLDELDQAAMGLLGENENRSIVAQRLLSRLDWHALDADQLQWLDRPSVQRLASAIRPWTAQAVDYAELLRQIERQESDSIDLAAIDIAGSVQSLRFADHDQARRVAGSLNTHYRNANVRMALSEKMLNRLLPAVEPKTVPVRTNVMGSRVRGVSQIRSDLAVSLTPTRDRWSINFQTLGHVTSMTTGQAGPVAVRTSGNNHFVANAPIQVTPQGVQLGDVNVDVRGRTRLRGIRTDYDGWPLVGALVRSFASSKFDSMKPQTGRIASAKIRKQVAVEVDSELEQRVDEASDKMSLMVLGPLGRMKLDPQVLDMETTDQRLVARYRLAGDWQLAAFTPRPRAPRTSLMSVQAHQSAINNTLEQLVPREELMSIPDVARRAAEMFGQTVDLPADVPEDVTIRFARTRPVTVEIEDGQIWVTLRVTQLSRGDNLNLTNFIVRALYRPEANGLQASLFREGHLRISGPNMSMRERLPIRAIFNKVLSADRPLPLTMPALVDHPAMEGLAISQLELRDGWIGLAISEHNAPKVAWNTETSTK